MAWAVCGASAPSAASRIAERSPQERLRRRVVGLGEVEDSQIVQRGCDRGIGRARRLFELCDAGLQLRQSLLRSLRRS